MTPFWGPPAVLMTLLSWMAAPPASLIEAANREALRRQLTARASSSLSNQDLPPALQVVTMPAGEAPPAPETAVLTPPPPPAPAPAAPATPPRDEQWWRDRIAAARTSLERNQVLSEGMQSRINGLQTDFVNRDDPAQREELRRQLQRALNELDRLKQLIAREEQAIKDIQTDARRSRIPAGWVR